MFTLGKDLENASIESARLEKDGTAELVISVPADSRTPETIDMFGQITVSAEALINNWGEKASADAVCSDRYSGQTMSRSITGVVSIGLGLLLQIQQCTRGETGFLGSMLNWTAKVNSSVNIIQKVLETLGVMKSSGSQEAEAFREINKKLDSIQKSLDAQTVMFQNLDKHMYEQDMEKYQDAMNAMMSAYNTLSNMYKNAAADAAGMGVTVPLTADPENATEAERQMYANYASSLTDIIISAYSFDPFNTRYSDYASARSELINNFNIVTDQLTMGHPLDTFDKFCSLEYNFDTQAYYPRALYREISLANLEKVIGLMHLLYKTSNDPYNQVFIGLNDKFMASAEILQNNYPTGPKPEEIKARPRIEKGADPVGTYVSEIKLACNEKSAQWCRDTLRNEGYTVIDKDLNKGARGWYIFLGYKTSNNVNDAITMLALRSGKNNNSPTWNATYWICEFNLCPCVGGNGDLNQGARGDYIYLYYTKHAGESSGITSIYVNGSKSGCVNEPMSGSLYFDLNRGAGGDDLFLHCDYAPTTHWEDTNTDYYPYCYSLGGKVSFYTAGTYRSGALGIGDATRNWTGEEKAKFLKRVKYPTLKEELEAAGIVMPYYCTLNDGIFQITPELIVTLDNYEEFSWGDYEKRNMIEKINNDLSVTSERGIIYNDYTAQREYINWLFFKLS